MGGTETGGATVTEGGGDHGDPDAEEFDPIGTLALILTYFAILVVAWIYVYFIEFLSRDLTVIGSVVG